MNLSTQTRDNPITQHATEYLNEIEAVLDGPFDSYSLQSHLLQLVHDRIQVEQMKV